MSDYPQHDKLQKVKKDSEIVGHFLESSGILSRVMKHLPQYKAEITKAPPWCQDELGLDVEVYVPDNLTIEKVLARHFGIDYEELMAEKERIYQSLKEARANPATV